MRQLKVLPAGCQRRSKVLALSERSITSAAFCPFNSTDLVRLAVSNADGSFIVWDVNQEVVLASASPGFGRLILWNPSSIDVCTTITDDPHLRVFSWHVGLQAPSEVFAAKDVTNTKVTVSRYSPHTSDFLVVGCTNGVIYMFSARYATRTVLSVAKRTMSVVDIQWDRLSKIYLLAAYLNMITLWDTESKSEIHVFEYQRSPITSVAWLDWTAGNFVTSNENNGNLKVWNASQKQSLKTIKVAASAINSLFVESGSKELLCACSDGSVAIYSFPKRKLEFSTCSGHTDTIFDCVFCPTDCNTFATASFDGSVKIWSVNDLTLIRSMQSTETCLYSVDWDPTGRLIVASSYSGRLVIWDARSGKELVQYTCHKKASFSVSWNHSNMNVIATTSADGSLLVIEVDCEALLTQDLSVTSSIFARKKSVKLSSEVEVSPQALLRFAHPSGVFGCSWCDSEESLLATGCEDCLVRVFDYRSESQPLLYVLQGHSARSFNCVWSPHVTGMLAAGSDDTNICLWLVDLTKSRSSSSAYNKRELRLPVFSGPIQPSKTLIGHTANVRALIFCPAHRQLLVSGSWDATIRVWNIDNGLCVWVATGHAADVYSVCAHLDRPFTFVSCSRDTTVRVWDLQSSGIFRLMRLAAVWDCDMHRIRRDDAEDSVQRLSQTDATTVTGIMPVLDGCQIVREVNDIAGDTKMLEKYFVLERFLKIFNFFSGVDGSVDLFEMIALSRRKGSFGRIHDVVPVRDSALRRLLHEEEILSSARAEALSLEAIKGGFERQNALSSKESEHLHRAAALYARCGDFAKYCKVMVQLGNWTAALSMAPSVSMEYWRALCADYAQHLLSLSSEQCVPPLLAVGRDADAVEFYLSRGDVDSALVVAKMSEGRTDIVPSYDVEADHEVALSALYLAIDIDTPGPAPDSVLKQLGEGGSANCGRVAERAVHEVEASRRTVQAVVTSAVDALVSSSQPVLAAAKYISVDDFSSALGVLLSAGEVELAFAVARCCSANMNMDTYVIALAEKFGELGALRMGVDVLGSLSPVARTAETALLISRFCEDDDIAREVLTAAGQNSSEKYWLNLARGNEETSSYGDAILCYINARNYSRAASIAVDELRKAVRHASPSDLPQSLKQLLRVAKSIRADRLDDTLKNSLLCYLLWFAAHEAAEALGLWETGWAMLRILRMFKGGESFTLSDEDVHFQEILFRIYGGDRKVTALLESLLRKNELSAEVTKSCAKLLALIDEALTSFENDSKSVFSPREARGSKSQRESPSQGAQSSRVLALASSKAQASTLGRLCQRYFWDKRTSAFSWGANAGAIFREASRLEERLSLPVPRRHYSSSVEMAAESAQSIPAFPYVPLLGSRNPTTRLQGELEARPRAPAISCISGSLILEAGVVLDGDRQMASVNELASWKRVLPFTPTMTGRFL